MAASAGIELLAAGLAASSGVLLLVRGSAPATGWLLVATALAIPPVVVGVPSNAAGFTLYLVSAGAAGPLAAVLAAAAGVSWTVGPFGTASRLVVALPLSLIGLVGGLLPALVFDPQAAGCNACPRNLLELHASLPSADQLARTAMWLTALWGPALAVLAAARWVQAPPLARRSSWPMLGAGAGIALLGAGSAIHAQGLPVGQVDDVTRSLWLGQCALIVVIAVGVLVRLYLVRTAAARMARIVLAAIPHPAAVIQSLQRAVADPGLAVCFRRADGAAIELDGGPAEPRTDRAVLQLSREQAVFAEIRYDPRLAGSDDLVRACAASAALALEYLAAQARLRAELRDLAAIRARLVAGGDAERRRLERNLHDGAQQRLIALGVMLGTASSSPASSWTRGRADPAAELAAHHGEIDLALQELRTVARGLFPTSLGEAGVHEALRELGDHTACPLLVTGTITGTVPLTVGMAVYQLVLDAAQANPSDSPVTVDLGGGGDAPARVTVTSARPAPAGLQQRLIHAEDRFVAAGGRLTVAETEQDLVLEGVAPCGS